MRLDDRGGMKEVARFDPPVGLTWHAFWAAEDLVYALNQSGEIYILRVT